MKFNTKVIHGGQIKEKGYGAVMPPIYQTSTYAQTKPGKHQGYEYSRTHNPTRTALENSIASIENGKHGLAFSSGLAAIDAVLKLFEPGDEIISTNDLYGGSYRPVSYTHLRAHETKAKLVCRLLLEKIKFKPNFLKTLSKSLYEPPYKSFVEIISSPGSNSFKTASIAASPELNAKPCLPFSMLAMEFSNAVLVGL